jgi:tRNA(Arg) A34 adenosine deaminase TadA
MKALNTNIGELMNLSNEEHFFLNQTLEIAKESVTNGNHPFGALLVYNGEIVCKSENEVIVTSDVTAHAELLLIQKAQSLLSSKELKESILYSSTEPCPMCTGAIYWSGIQKVIYGTKASKLLNIAGDGFKLSALNLVKYAPRDLDFIAASNTVQFDKLHFDFWR